jgi:NADPH:quinone reductase-like Zn-dependent oxidoreductase
MSGNERDGRTSEAWVLSRSIRPGIPGNFRRATVTLPRLGPTDLLVRPLYGSWEGNMDHALRASPVDVCRLRGEETVVLGNAGVVEVMDVGSQVTEFASGSLALVFPNGSSDDHDYPKTIFGYDAPGTIGVLARQTVIGENQLLPLPAGTKLSLQQWAAFSLRWITAWANWRVAWSCYRVQMPEIPPEQVHVWGWGGGVALAELALAAQSGCRATMLTSRPERAREMLRHGISSVDRSSFAGPSFESAFLELVQEKTQGQGVSIFVDNIGAQPGATLKAVGRQGVITTSGWKSRTIFPLSRPVECQNRRTHVFTHYATRREGRDAIAWAESTGWAPQPASAPTSWDAIETLAADYARGEVVDYHPVFEINPEAGRGTRHE